LARKRACALFDNPAITNHQVIFLREETMITGKSNHPALTKHSKCFYEADSILQIVL